MSRYIYCIRYSNHLQNQTFIQAALSAVILGLLHQV